MPCSSATLGSLWLFLFDSPRDGLIPRGNSKDSLGVCFMRMGGRRLGNHLKSRTTIGDARIVTELNGSAPPQSLLRRLYILICENRRMPTRTIERARTFALGLQDGFLSLAVSCGTKPMLWLSRRVIWLEPVCHNPRCKFLKRIAGALLIPPL